MQMENDQKPDLEAMLNLLMPFARPMLEQYGEFYSFAGVMDAHGNTRVITGDTTESELVNTLKKNAEQGEYRAVALCKNVRVTTNSGATDAIQIVLEHKTGQALHAFLPYKITENKTVTYGELFFESSEAIFYV
jgi:hypothetical protein